MRTSGFVFRTGKWAIPGLKNKFYYEHDANNLKSEELLINTASAHETNPQFSYAHFLMPHWPYYRDSLGNYVNESIIADESNIHDKNIYLSYLKYTNHVILKIINSIVSKDHQSIIIVMSDHGYRSYNISDDSPLNFDNIVACRIPSVNYLTPDKEMSNVNFFRYLFNRAFGQNFPYLPDSTIELGYAK